VRRAIEAMGALLRGEARDLSAIALDMERVPAFHRRVYEAARAIAPGRTLTYGEIAQRIGAPGSARAVGQALGRNPFAIVVPCHRVLAAGGKAGGFSAGGGVSTKLRMLAIEGAPQNGAAASSAGAKTTVRSRKADREGGAPALFAADAGYGFDPATALAHLRAADATLARLIDRVGPFRMEMKRTPSLFVALAEAIVYQQLHGKAAATIYGRLCALFPRPKAGPTADGLLRMSDETLRGAGLSRQKLLSLRDLAQRAQAGEIPTLAAVKRMGDDEIVERLSEVRGIGRWTAEMLLIFRLGRPDVLPVDDFGVRKGFMVAFKRPEMPSRDEVTRRGERWRPYRTVASWYLWRATETAKPSPG
jgi:methylated-DNA-[protein]-cysteine S-methyltransferase